MWSTTKWYAVESRIEFHIESFTEMLVVVRRLRIIFEPKTISSGWPSTFFELQRSRPSFPRSMFRPIHFHHDFVRLHPHFCVMADRIQREVNGANSRRVQNGLSFGWHSNSVSMAWRLRCGR